MAGRGRGSAGRNLSGNDPNDVQSQGKFPRGKFQLLSVVSAMPPQLREQIIEIYTKMHGSHHSIA